MKVLLISLQPNTDAIGLKYIHSHLQHNKINSSILFLPRYNKNKNIEIKKFLEDFNPKIIGISLMSNDFNKAKELSKYIKKNFLDIIIVFGGIHATIDPVSCLNYADYVLVGEGEKSFLEFIKKVQKNKSVNNVTNLVYKFNKKIIMNKLKPLDENLDIFPFPDFFPKNSFILHKGEIVKLGKIIFKKYMRYAGRFYSVVTTRGCPFSCAYCCNSFFSRLYGKKIIRERSVENVIEELKEGIKQFPETIYVNIQDDCFFVYDIEWLKKFAKLYKKEIKRKFVCRSTPAHLTEEKIRILNDAGLSWIFMGLQTGSEKINRDIYKRFVTNKKFIETAKMVRKYNLACYYDVICDNPYETDEDTVQTINVLLEIPKPFILQQYSLCFYQGTEIYERAKKDKLKTEDPLKKNYQDYKPTFLNKAIRLTPILPRPFIRYLVKNRKSNFAKGLMSLVYPISMLLIEPFVWFRLLFISFNYNIFKTMKTVIFFSKTGFIKMILRNKVYS